MIQEYDLIVIGSGPAGEKAAVKAAYFDYNVALLEKNDFFGGAGIQTGTLPSKTLKETALYLSGVYNKGIFSMDKEFGRHAGIQDFMYRKNLVTHEGGNSVKQNLIDHKVTIYKGCAEFINEHEILVKTEDKEEVVHGKNIVIATGSYPVHPSNIPFDQKRVHDSDSILTIDRFPKSLCVLGAGVVGCEYATIFAAMGIPTYIINNSDKILGFLDTEIAQALVMRMQKNGIQILFNNSVDRLHAPSGEEDPLTIELKNGEVLKCDMFLFAAGRNGNTKQLKCKNAGILMNERETINVNAKFQTNVSHIYAVGDVVGFPALASTSMDQGRIAIAHMFNTKDLEHLATVFPYGIYTVPEVSMVGMTEEYATKNVVDYGVGYSNYKDTIRGKILGDTDNGFLKLIFEKQSKVIVGVHIIGVLATEIIHYGMSLVKERMTLENVIATVFNFPSLHDLYKYASYDALSSLKGKRVRGKEERIGLSSQIISQ
jgi:NAD(P) transhydrogenase